MMFNKTESEKQDNLIVLRTADLGNMTPQIETTNTKLILYHYMYKVALDRPYSGIRAIAARFLF